MWLIRNTQRADYNSFATINGSHADWMKSVPDDRRIVCMTLPGTHDSLALYGGDLSQTQSLNIPQQLEAGIRFLDVRPCLNKRGKLPIYHGIMYQHVDFEQVLNDITNFLREHPSEGVFMRIREERPPPVAAQITFADALLRVCSEVGREFFVDIRKGRLDISSLKLGHMRSRICVLQDYGGRSLPGALPWRGASLQDEWEIATVFHISRKIKAIRRHMQKASAANEGLWINFLSGASALCYPYTAARHTNYAAMVALQRMKFPSSCGMIVADFPGIELIRACIHLNLSDTCHGDTA